MNRSPAESALRLSIFCLPITVKMKNTYVARVTTCADGNVNRLSSSITTVLLLYLRVHHGYGHPVVAPEQSALGTKFAELLNKSTEVPFILRKHS